jgi:hypothetical protein
MLATSPTTTQYNLRTASMSITNRSQCDGLVSNILEKTFTSIFRVVEVLKVTILAFTWSDRGKSHKSPVIIADLQMRFQPWPPEYQGILNISTTTFSQESCEHFWEDFK